MMMARFLKSSIWKNIFVLNCGSSSIKFKLFQTKQESDMTTLIEGVVERLNDDATIKVAKLYWNRGKLRSETEVSNSRGEILYTKAIKEVCKIIMEYSVTAIGHRVVHGGQFFVQPARIDVEVEKNIKECCHLAPLHNPNNLLGIKIARKVMGDNIPQVAVFDTAFHSTMPPKAYRYAIPNHFYLKHKIRRYGFHGMSHESVTKKAIQILNLQTVPLRIITLHLGNGCSITASIDGRSVDTSMGFSPLEGVMMGQRCGDIDPAIVGHMNDILGGNSLKAVYKVLNQESGFLGIANLYDSRDLEVQYLEGDTMAKLAIDMFCYRIAKYVSSYCVALGGIPNALVFTGGIGEKSYLKRALILDQLAFLGFNYDEERNQNHGRESVGFISKENEQGPRVMVIATHEEMVIAKETLRVLHKTI